MIDYAHPTLMAEKALKDLHNAMLERRYEDAIEHGLQAIVETRLAIHAIRNDIEKNQQKVVDTR